MTASTCSLCGVTTESADDQLPPGWSLSTSPRGVDRVCEACTRTHIRAIEAKLPEEYW